MRPRILLAIVVAASAATASSLSAQADSIDHVEAVQVVQDSAGSVPLFAGKTTVVRVFYSGQAQGAAGGRLWIRRAGEPDEPIQTADGLDLSKAARPLPERRRNAAASLNFTVRKPREGSLVITRVEVWNAATGAPLPCRNCARPRTLVFQRGPELRLQLVGLRHTQGPAPRPAPRPEDFTAIQRWIERNYPIGQLHVKSRVVDVHGKVNSCETANRLLADIRSADMDAGHHPRTRYYGVLSDKGGEVQGCSAWIPPKPNPAVVSSGPAGPLHPKHDWDRDGSYADWYAGHEIAHTLARKHIMGECGDATKDKDFPFPGGRLTGARPEFVGWDVDRPAGSPGPLLPGNEWHDVMTYCRQQWMSSHTYAQILRALEEEEKSSGGPAPSAAPGGQAPNRPGASGDGPRWVALSARVNPAKRAGAIMSLIPTRPVPRDTLHGRDSVSVRIRNVAGAVLDSIGMSWSQPSDGEKRSTPERSVQQVVRVAPDAYTVELMLDTLVVDVDTVSGPAPRLTRVEPRRTVDYGSRGAVEFTWDTGQGDSDELTYTVQVWFEGAEFAETMATGLRQKRIVIDDEQRMGRAVTGVEVIASNRVRVQARRTKVPSR